MEKTSQHPLSFTGYLAGGGWEEGACMYFLLQVYLFFAQLGSLLKKAFLTFPESEMDFINFFKFSFLKTKFKELKKSISDSGNVSSAFFE